MARCPRANADAILRLVEHWKPGFAKVRGLELEDGRIPNGIKIDEIRSKMRKIWPAIPDEIKREYLRAQLMAGIHYALECMDCYQECGIPFDRTEIITAMFGPRET